MNYEALANEYQTPLFIYSGEQLESTFYNLRNALPEPMEIFYSLKANPNISIYSFLKALGAQAEVCSLTELATALQAGTDPNKIIFLGPGKSDEELAACLEAGVFTIVAESIDEIVQIDAMAKERNQKANVAIRVNPEFSVKGTGLTMGGKPRQFGIDEKQVMEQAPTLRSLTHARLMGIHVYMGTRILEEQVVVDNTTKILALAEKISAYVGFPLEMVDVGGGLGVPYFSGEGEPDLKKLNEGIREPIRKFHEAHPSTRILFEVGRYLVGKSGTLVSRVRFKKMSMGKEFLVTDGGTNCHMAAVGIGSFVKRNFPIQRLSSGSEAKTTYTITGPLCTPNDVIGSDVEIGVCERGALVGVFHSGAYGPTASPVQFLSHGYPAEVLVYQEKSYLIRARDTAADLLGKQIALNLNLTPNIGGSHVPIQRTSAVVDAAFRVPNRAGACL